MAHAIRSTRLARLRIFERDLFGEPAWDILLGLYIARGGGYALSVTDACSEAPVPKTTALRWLEYLCTQGLAVKRDNRMDQRSTLVEISRQGITRMNTYLSEVVPVLSRS